MSLFPLFYGIVDSVPSLAWRARSLEKSNSYMNYISPMNDTPGRGGTSVEASGACFLLFVQSRLRLRDRFPRWPQHAVDVRLDRA